MIAEFITNHVFMCSILLFGIFSVFLQWLTALSLKSYVKASANMKTTKKKIMINLKNQFETIYGMDYQVHNIAAYVDKYLLKLRFFGLSLSFWEKLPFLSAGIVTLLAGGSAFYTYRTTANSNVLIEILFSYGVVLACLFVFFHIFGIKSKKQQIQIQLVDYLENYLTNRVIRNRDSSRELKMLDESMEEEFMKGITDNKKFEEGMEEEKLLQEDRLERDSDEEIQALIDLVKEMDRNLAKQGLLEENVQKQIAASKEISLEDDLSSKEEAQSDGAVNKSEIELLEEFVQSFLA